MKWRPFLFVATGFASAVAIFCTEIALATPRLDGSRIDGTSRAVFVLFIFPLQFVALSIYAMFLGPIVEHSTTTGRTVAVRSISLISIQLAGIAIVSCLMFAFFGIEESAAIDFVVDRITIPFALAAIVTSVIGIREMLIAERRGLNPTESA